MIKKSITIIALGIILSSSVLPAIAETSSVIPKEASTENSSEITESTIPQPTTTQTTSESTTSDSKSSESHEETHKKKDQASTQTIEVESNAQIASSDQEKSETLPKVSNDTANVVGDTFGTNGTSPWTLASDGTLTIKSGTFTSAYNGWDKNAVKKIVIEGKVVAAPNSSELFGEFSGVTEISGLANLDTSNVTNMSSIFRNMSSLTSIDLSSLDTSNVTDMSYMFDGDTSLASLDVSTLNTSKVTNMSTMFYDLQGLTSTSLDLSNFDTSNVTDMTTMFGGSKNLTNINLSSFDTSKVTSMTGMFENDWNLDSLNLSSFDTSNVVNMSYMFYSTPKITSLDLSSFNTSSVVNISSMFGGMQSLKELDLSNFDSSDVSNMSEMFRGDSLLSKVTLGSNFKFLSTSNAGLPDISVTDLYTGKWQNVGNGTEISPSGKNVWTSDEFMSNYSGSTDADTYVWQTNKVSGGDVTVQYTDVDGNKIFDDVVKSGNVGDDYSTEQKDIEGYTFKEVQGNPTGQFTDTPQTVTYVYTKNPVKAADVISKYVDTEGNKISDDVVKSGNIGDKYTTEQKDIEGYTFKEMGKDSAAVSGDFTDKAQTVTYVYTKDKVNPVTPTPAENKPSHKEDTHKSVPSSSTHDTLPETGENERMTLMSVGTGLILLMVALIASIFRFKKFKNNK